MNNWLGLLSLLGPASIAVALFVLGALSKRLGNVTHAKRYYIGFYVAAFLIVVGLVIRAARVVQEGEPVGQLIVYDLFMAAGVTLGVIITWRYWSWLLAERD